MVRHTNNRSRRRNARWLAPMFCLSGRTSRAPWKIYLLLFLMFVSVVSSARAGDLKNKGTINNTGKIMVKNQATGLPLINNGVYEFLGGNQTIPSAQYQDLVLSGSGIKTLTGTGVAIYDTLTIASGVTAVTDPGAVAHVVGILNEQGYLQGVADKTDNLTGASGSSNYGNLGATISWTGTAPGVTTVVRTTGTAIISPLTGKQSIGRYFDIAPTFSTGLNATLVFKYADIELNGHNPNTLELWRSPDGGATWRRQGGTVDVVQRTITKAGIRDFSRWTASDAANPLGPLYYEGVAQNIALTSGSGQSAAPGTILPLPFLITVRDAYGNPISGTNVVFAIATTPSGTTGHSLSVTSATTGPSGQASTVLTLGTVAGTYTVTAASPGLSGSPITFTATATGVAPPPPPPPPSPVPTSIALTAGQGQADTVTAQLGSPFTVAVLSQFGTPFSGVQVRFTVASTPSGAVGTTLTDTLVLTNALGQASTRLTLGTKVGTYTVSASSGSLTGSPITFAATAIAGRPVYLLSTAGNAQSAPVRTTLPQPLVVSVTDTFGNVKQGVNVRFAITSAPLGATGQALSDSVVTTGADGQAAVRLTLGDSVGVYQVAASSGTLLGSPLTFTANATPSVGGATIALTAGEGQRAPVNTTLANPFVVTVRNSLGSVVAGVPVTFAIVDTPAGAIGQRLTPIQSVTDSLGRASALLTLGNRPGIYRIAVSSEGLSGSPVLFTATADVGSAASLALVAGNDQIGVVRTRLLQPFTVTVLDAAGNPVRGAAVTFAIDSIPSGAVGQSFNGASSMVVATDSAGLASAFLTLGDQTGVYRATATSSGLVGSPLVFRATAVTSAGAVRMVYTAGDAQSAAILTDLSSPLAVTVLNASGNPVSGQTVTFAVDSIPLGATGQLVTPSTVTTGASGRATAVAKVGSKVGVYRVTATSAGLAGSPVEFRVQATVGVARALVYLAGDGQSKQITGTLDSAFVVRVVDLGENPVPGVAVHFSLDSIPDGAMGQRLTALNPVTDAQGQAAAVLTLGSKIGTYVVSASVEGLSGSPLKFIARASAGAAAAMILTSGNEQTGYVSTDLAAPFTVTIVDIAGNPVPGIGVQFAIDSIPAGANGQSLRVLNTITDQGGQASAVLTLGDKIGRYTVTAVSSGLIGSPARFAATARVLVGDVNTDREVDVADLTTIIDHILGRVTLVGNDSAKADINRDGRINVVDVVALQNNLLAIAGVPATSDISASPASARMSGSSLSVGSDTTMVRSEFVLTQDGLRFNIANSVPLKGIELVVRFKNSVDVQSLDVVFPRALVDSFYLNVVGREARIVAYNLKNNPIAVGDGPIFRLPIVLSALDDIESSQLVVSAADTVTLKDQALRTTPEKRLVGTTEIPSNFILYQNYPNPFNSSTRIEFQLPDRQGGGVKVLIQVFDLVGEKIKTLVSGYYAGGRYGVSWDGTDDRGGKVSSGTYYYRLISGDYVSGKKMILLK